MSNFIKEKEFEQTIKMPDGRIVMVLGMLRQHTVKHNIRVMLDSVLKGRDTVVQEALAAIIPVDSPYARDRSIRKQLFLGYAICSPEDAKDGGFSTQLGKRLCRKRFGKPLETNNFSMLNDDMCNLIVTNECEYIVKNIDKYLNRKSSKDYRKEVEEHREAKRIERESARNARREEMRRKYRPQTDSE